MATYIPYESFPASCFDHNDQQSGGHGNAVRFSGEGHWHQVHRYDHPIALSQKGLWSSEGLPAGSLGVPRPRDQDSMKCGCLPEAVCVRVGVHFNNQLLIIKC